MNTHVKMKERHTSISCVKENGTGDLNYWSVEKSGDWKSDYDTGANIACDLWEYLHKFDEPMVLEKIVGAMKEIGAVETGFLRSIGELIASN